MPNGNGNGKPPSFEELMDMLGQGKTGAPMVEYVQRLMRDTAKARKAELRDAAEAISPNVLAERYVTPEIKAIFSERGKTLAERELWIAVMKAQRELGLDIPGEDITKFEAAKNDIDLDFIRRREEETRHDVKAKIEAFVNAAGAGEHIHKGMTSRDLTDNVEQMQCRKATDIILEKYAAVLYRMAEKSLEYADLVISARTHHQPAQPTTLGRRFSMWAEELNAYHAELEGFASRYPLRGIKGPVGTQFDMLTLLGDKTKVDELEREIAKQLGFSRVIESPGQVYPRSLDYALISILSLVSSPCENFAKSMRLMAGDELVTEGFKEGQVGSSAMPHKMNTRSSERICGLSELAKMYANGASRISGDQWEEGDVSESVVRRVVLPDAFYASDGICETTLTVLKEMGAYPAVIQREMDRYMPFLATTEILMHAVKAGVGREKAHKVIKKYAVDEALKMRQAGTDRNELAYRLAADPVFAEHGITEEQINGILNERPHFIGNARRQIDAVYSNAKRTFDRYPTALTYQPRPIL